jgi:anaerobic ribonucleoside-triphosphate reductase activating protein
MSVKELEQDIRKTANIDGVSITGGEPLDQYEEVLKLVRLLSPTRYTNFYEDGRRVEDAGGYPILLTTGYTYEIIQARFPDILHSVDILIDGPFISDMVDKTSTLRGSTNQNVRYLTGRANRELRAQDRVVNAEVRINSQGDGVITGFAIPESLIPNKKSKSRYDLAKD